MGLYQNLEGRQSGRLVREAYMKSNLSIEGIDYKEAARYVAMGCDLFDIRKLGLESIVPKRKHKY